MIPPLRRNFYCLFFAVSKDILIVALERCFYSRAFLSSIFFVVLLKKLQWLF